MRVKTLRLFSGIAVLAVAAAALVVMASRGAVKLATGTTVLADSLNCDLSQYKAATGLTAAIDQNLLVVTWAGQGGTEMRARYAIDSGKPVVRDVAVRKGGGQWGILGQNLTPEFRVTSGIRRMSTQQAEPLLAAGVELTPEVITKNRWYAFWDAPLVLPDGPEMRDARAYTAPRSAPDPYAPADAARGQQAPAGGRGPVGAGFDATGRIAGAAPARGRGPGVLPAARVVGPPRTAADIKRASASFNTTSCSVKTDGASLEANFSGLSMGIFAGDLRFTAYRGTNLWRMEALAKTNEQWIAYKYEAGLKGFTTDVMQRVTWHDTGGQRQHNELGGVVNETIVPEKAQNRVLVAEGKAGSLAAFTPPHTFFFTREKDTNLGYVWFRKDAAGSFAIGIRQPDREEDPQYVENFALYNAPPGTVQRMPVYFYATPGSAESTRQEVMAFTHGDAFKPVAGYKTFVNHFHLDFTGRVRATGSFDTPMQDLAAMRALGLNVIGLSDFHFELHANDPGPLRFRDQKDYFEATRHASDADFLITPWEEPSAYFGGHYNILFPKRNVYWSKVRTPGQPFTEVDPVYGKVYHTGSAADVQAMMDAEGAYWYHAHPRTKGTTGYPDLIFDKPYVKNDRYLGVAFKPGMGQDNSEARMCDWRCFDTVDTMNNMYANSGIAPKYIIADIDTYRKGPEDDTYANFPVNYLKIDKVPGPDEDITPVLKALRDGNYFVTNGEILVKNYSVAGTGAQRTITADVEWTYPLAFVEVVWGDGKKVDRQIIPATDLGPFGTKHFAIPFNATGKSWVRFAVWDSAGDGGFVQPVWLNSTKTTN
ncbi:MAG TPA: hypothetical protein VGZ27_02835 [Vicinamibacterales bacterium]|jgi:hypothetical protein|nr:hypothetical protein [Vicinamibacterales bacterium]